MKKILYILLFLTFSFSSFAQNGGKINVQGKEISDIRVYPNPFKNKTTISFTSTQSGNISFIVQDLLGNIVKSENILLTKGKNTIPFYKNKLSTGIYIYTLKTKDKLISKRFVIN